MAQSSRLRAPEAAKHTLGTIPWWEKVLSVVREKTGHSRLDSNRIARQYCVAPAASPGRVQGWRDCSGSVVVLVGNVVPAHCRPWQRPLSINYVPPGAHAVWIVVPVAVGSKPTTHPIK